MAKLKVHIGKSAGAAGKTVAARVALRALKQAMGDFDGVEVVEPAVKPPDAARKAIRKAVRAYYKRDALERA
jgi:hypothetical protein